MHSRWNVADGSGGPEYQPRSRALPPTRAGEPPLELLEALPSGPPRGAPILFLHGAFAGAWCWNEIFLPYFARRGRHAAAVSFRAHGGSGGRDRLRTIRLSDYVDDARRAIAALPSTPVVVGHSLGGLVGQRLIGATRMRALVLLASLPPEGMALLGPRIAVTDPLIWFETFFGSVARRKGPIAAASEQLLFSDGLPQEKITRYARMMVPESPQALLDAHMPGPIVPALFAGLRTLVIGGDRDRIVWRGSTLRTALYHGATHESLAGVGHCPQLDMGAEDAARRILDWIDRAGA